MKIKEGMEVNSSIKALVNIGLNHPNLSAPIRQKRCIAIQPIGTV
jgi:hypothetical protein